MNDQTHIAPAGTETDASAPVPGLWTGLSFKLGLRRLSAILGPAMFSLRTGHLLSALAGRSMDARGKPLPWYSYPAIRFLSQHDFSTTDVLEFGGGQSTQWWARRARSVVCLDPHAPWVEWLKTRTPANAEIHHLQKLADVPELLGGRSFDVIVVDAGTEEEPTRDRIGNMGIAMKRLNSGGLLVVDNTTPAWARPISEMAARDGWARVDFIGFSPGGMSEYGTSIFFKVTPTILLNGRQPRSPKQMRIDDKLGK